MFSHDQEAFGHFDKNTTEVRWDAPCGSTSDCVSSWGCGVAETADCVLSHPAGRDWVPQAWGHPLPTASHGRPSAHVCVLISSHEDASPVGSELPVWTCLRIQSHPETLGVWTPTCGFGGTRFSHNIGSAGCYL